MALIFSAQRARFGFTLRDKQPKAGKTSWISSVICTNTALSELRSPVLGSGEIWLQVVQTAWSWEELGFRFPWSWLVPAAGESGSSGCLAVLAPGCVTPRDVHLCLWPIWHRLGGQILSSVCQPSLLTWHRFCHRNTFAAFTPGASSLWISRQNASSPAARRSHLCTRCCWPHALLKEASEQAPGDFAPIIRKNSGLRRCCYWSMSFFLLFHMPERSVAAI